MFLAGDIGGTKTDLCIFSPGDPGDSPVVQAEDTFFSNDAPSLEALVSRYISREKVVIRKAVFAVAGPVMNRKADITNLPWVIREDRLRQVLNIPPVSLINDLEAVAYHIPHLSPEETHVLNTGVQNPGGNIGIVAPGTGLGESFLTSGSSGYQAHACEGGHGDFAPTRPIEIRLLDYLLRDHAHVSCERVCSGMGLPDIYRFLRDGEGLAESDELRQRIDNAADPTAVIINGAMDGTRSSGLCVSTLELFTSALGAEAGNLALKVMATGGVYLAGGIPPRILRFLSQGGFMDAFRSKGRMAPLLADIPVHVILNPKAALRGAMQVALSS